MRDGLAIEHGCEQLYILMDFHGAPPMGFPCCNQLQLSLISS